MFVEFGSGLNKTRYDLMPNTKTTTADALKLKQIERVGNGMSKDIE